jgi:hypothetical protein
MQQVMRDLIASLPIERGSRPRWTTTPIPINGQAPPPGSVERKDAERDAAGSACFSLANRWRRACRSKILRASGNKEVGRPRKAVPTA